MRIEGGYVMFRANRMDKVQLLGTDDEILTGHRENDNKSDLFYNLIIRWQEKFKVSRKILRVFRNFR